MNPFADQVNAVHRQVGAGRLEEGEARTIVLRRDYAADVEDVWDALTDPKRLVRWFLPVSGDLRPGGRYQLEGNAGGEILRCESPHVLTVSWVFGDMPPGQVEVRLSPADDGEGTTFQLTHTVPVDDHWQQFGPGAVGVGWDLALPALALHLAGGTIENPAEWASSPEAVEFMLRCSQLWGEAHESSGQDPGRAEAMAAATASAYAPQDR